MRIRLGALLLAALGAGCGPKPVISGDNLADSLEPDSDLVLCINPQGGYEEIVVEAFSNARRGKSYFSDVKRVDSLDETGGCDLVADYRHLGATIFSPSVSNVYSAYSRKKVFQAQARGFDPERQLGEAIYRAFKPGTPLYAQIKAEAGAQARTAAPAAAPALSAAESVDQPAHHLTENPSDFALVVGVEKYSNDLPEAQFAERDAAAVKAHLLALGYPERNMKFLTGARATGTNLAAYLEDWLPRMVKPDSRVFFYFSGHGAPSESGQAFLVPWDGNPNFLDKTAYPLKKLYAKLGSLKAKQVIVALDSCFSGSGGRSVLAEGARPLVTTVDTSVSPGSRLVLFAAASPKEITATLKEQGHGIFTYYFLKGLGGEAQDASGAVTARGLYDYLKPKVQDAAARQNRDQTPVLEGAAGGELVRFK